MCSDKEIIVNNSETVLHLIFKFVGSLFEIFVESYPLLILEVYVISKFLFCSSVVCLLVPGLQLPYGWFIDASYVSSVSYLNGFSSHLMGHMVCTQYGWLIGPRSILAIFNLFSYQKKKKDKKRLKKGHMI